MPLVLSSFSALRMSSERVEKMTSNSSKVMFMVSGYSAQMIGIVAKLNPAYSKKVAQPMLSKSGGVDNVTRPFPMDHPMVLQAPPRARTRSG